MWVREHLMLQSAVVLLLLTSNLIRETPTFDIDFPRSHEKHMAVFLLLQVY